MSLFCHQKSGKISKKKGIFFVIKILKKLIEKGKDKL